MCRCRSAQDWCLCSWRCNQEAIRGFFTDIYALYLRVRLACAASLPTRPHVRAFVCVSRLSIYPCLFPWHTHARTLSFCLASHPFEKKENGEGEREAERVGEEREDLKQCRGEKLRFWRFYLRFWSEADNLGGCCEPERVAEWSENEPASADGLHGLGAGANMGYPPANMGYPPARWPLITSGLRQVVMNPFYEPSSPIRTPGCGQWASGGGGGGGAGGGGAGGGAGGAGAGAGASGRCRCCSFSCRKCRRRSLS